MADETFYKGEIRILYIKVSGLWLPIACLTGNPFSEEADMIQTTTRENEGWESSIPTNQRYNISFNGLQILTGDAGDGTKLSYDTLKGLKRARTKIEWKIEDQAQNFTDIGFGYIQSISESNEVGEFLTFEGSIVGHGEPTFSSTPGYIFEDGEAYIFEDGTGYLFNN